MKFLNISHADLDGIACSIISKLVFGDNIQCINMGNDSAGKMNNFYAKVIEEADEYDTIFITDLSVPPKSAQLMDEYNKAKKRNVFYICDHHKSALDEFDCEYDWRYILADDKSETEFPHCGASIYWDVLEALLDDGRFYSTFNDIDDLTTLVDTNTSTGTAEKLKKFIELTRLWDTYQWTDIENKELAYEAVLLNDVYNTTSMEYIYSLITGTSAGNTEYVLCTNTVLPLNVTNMANRMRINRERIQSKRVEKFGIHYYLVKIDNEFNLIHPDVLLDGRYNENEKYKTLIMIGSDNVADTKTVTEALFPEVEVVIVWDIAARKIQFRVSDNSKFDAKEFCLNRGGGGHIKAAGITYPVDLAIATDSFIKNDALRKTLEQLRSLIYFK